MHARAGGAAGNIDQKRQNASLVEVACAKCVALPQEVVDGKDRIEG